MCDATRKENDDDGHSDRDTDTDCCLPFRRVTKPPQDPGCGRRTDERSTGDVIFEDWRARSIASATERVTAAKSEQCEHVSRPDDSDRHAHRNAQRHERALCVGCAWCRFSFTHDEHCATHDAPRTPHPGLCGAASGPKRAGHPRTENGLSGGDTERLGGDVAVLAVSASIGHSGALGAG